MPSGVMFMPARHVYVSSPMPGGVLTFTFRIRCLTAEQRPRNRFPGRFPSRPIHRHHLRKEPRDRRRYRRDLQAPLRNSDPAFTSKFLIPPSHFRCRQRSAQTLIVSRLRCMHFCRIAQDSTALSRQVLDAVTYLFPNDRTKRRADQDARILAAREETICDLALENSDPSRDPC